MHVSRLGICDSSFLKEKGDDVSIIGGCGVSLSDLVADKSVTSVQTSTVASIVDRLNSAPNQCVYTKDAERTLLTFRVPFITGTLDTPIDAMARAASLWDDDCHLTRSDILHSLIASSTGAPESYAPTVLESLLELYGGDRARVLDDTQGDQW